MLNRYLLAPLTALLLLVATHFAQAQTGSVGIGTTTPAASAALDITATDKGLLVPRMTAAQRQAIASPVPAGLLVYQTDGTLPGFWYYEATAGWTQLGASGTTATNGLTQTGMAIGLGGTLTKTTSVSLAGYGLSFTGGSVGIGASNPTAGLLVSTAEKPSVSTTGGVYLSGGSAGNPSLELRGSTGLSYIDFANDLTSDYTARLLSASDGLRIYNSGSNSPSLHVSAAGVGVGGQATASAALDVMSTTRGFLPPRLSQTQRNAISSPATGLVVYNTDTNHLNSWNGTSWDAPINATEQATQNPSTTFGYTGGTQTYTVPAGVSSLTVMALGASGGQSYDPFGRNTYGPGGGARVQATVPVTAGEVLTITVGGQGGRSTSTSTAAGYNGGGGGSYNMPSNYQGGGGGGQTDLKRSGSYVLVAAGGGGGGFYGAGGAGGAPDGATGGTTSGTNGTPGTGATQATAGMPGGATGQGGDARPVYEGGGGGGGYLGGGGGDSAGGGGGSSWVTPTGSSAITMQAGVNGGTYSGAQVYNTANGSLTITPGLAYAAPVLSGTNFVNVPGDNLGNHTATQNLNLATYQLVGNGSSTGLSISSAGSVGIGTTTPGQKLDVVGNAAVSGAAAVGGTLTAAAASITGNATVGGSVGLGTSSPTQKLDVNGGILARSSGLISNQGAYLHWNRSGSDGATWLLNQKGVGIGGILFGSSDNVSSGSNTVTEWARFDGSGNLGLGTSSPAGGLHIDRPEVGSTTALGVTIGGGSSGNPSIELRGSGKSPYIDFVEASGLDYSTRLLSSGGTLSLSYGGAAASKPSYILNVQGGLQCVGTVNTSDQRLKQDVRPLHGALASVLALRGVRYRWNALGVQRGGTAGAEQVGVLAQEVEIIYPELVSTDAQGYKAVNYAQLTPVLIEALKEQQQQIESLKAEAGAAKVEAATANSRAVSAEAKATQATATLETFEARLRRLESASGGQAQR